MKAGQEVGDYVLQELLGEGREGEVWLGHQRDSRSEPLAIKVCHSLPRNDQTGPERAQRVAAQRLEHPHIVRLRDFFFHDAQPVFVMDYIAGESLADRIDACGPLPTDEVRHIARQILDALDYAHQHGVTHRDVKPSNILLDLFDQAHLADFGIALTAGQRRLTAAGITMGTPEYMSPEQFMGMRNSSPHLSDEYSFGCVLHEMLTGRPPFGSREGDLISEYELMTRHACKSACNVDPLSRGIGVQF